MLLFTGGTIMGAPPVDCLPQLGGKILRRGTFYGSTSAEPPWTSSPRADGDALEVPEPAGTAPEA